MSYNNFGRGRGFGQRGTRPFGRPRFPRPPYRHAGPPRPAHSMSFGMPWQPNNMLFQPHLRGNPQFRPDGRRKRFNSYDIRFPAPNRPPAPLGFEEVIPLSSSPQVENNQIDVVPQLPLLGSEEERQQKITETADRLKQKLSCITNDKMTDAHQNDDIPVPPVEDKCTEVGVTSVLGYESSELNLTYNDLKDIEKINSDNLMQDDTQLTTDIFDVTINANNDAILEENEDGSQVEVISNNQILNMENLPDDDYMEVNKWEFQEPIDNSQNLEQLDFHRDNIESELLKSDQCQYDIPLANISQDQYDQEQDISQRNEIHSIPVKEGQDIFETSHLQNISFSVDSANQDIMQKDMSQTEEEPIANLEVQEDVLNSHVYTQSSSSNNCTPSQTVLASTPVLNNSTLDNQLPRTQENSFPSRPPKLSPHTEQELPIDFDPTTPPPILLKQEQPQALPPFPISDLPPLFDPTEPPPNMRNLHGINIPHDSANSAWNINTQNPVSAAYNTEVHTELSMHGGFISQQLPLGMSSQGNVFLSPSIDAINFSPVYAVPPSNHPGVATNIPSALPQIHAVSCNTYVSSSPPIELSPSSNVHYSMNSVNKDDGLDEMQEAMKFAKQMANITETEDERSKPNSKSLSESCTSVNPINNIESISLPPGKPKTKINKSKRTKQDDTHEKKISEKQRMSDNPLSEEAMVQDANIRSTDASIMSEQDRPKVVFNLNNKTIKVSSKNTWQETNEKRNGMTQSVESEKTYVTSPVTKKNSENPLRRNEEGEKNLRKNENSSETAVSSESIVNQNVLSHKKIQKDSHTERSQRSTVSLPKVNVQKLKDRTEKNDSSNSNSEASWKNKIISRFLKMSKNDIYNMVNNTSLRKFDVIMKRLVKEKKSTLSLEMRHAQDEKIKLYDQQEFMKQLNQMLDTEATVSITDLPTEFIHHLNEVLQLDVQPDNHAEFAVASSSQSSHSEDTSRVLNTMTRFMECATRTLNDVNQECVKSKSHVTKRGYDKDIQVTRNTKNNDFNLKDRKEDICNTIVSNKPSTSGKLSTLQLDLDDILSEVTKKNQDPVIIRERKNYSVEQTKYIDDAALKNIEKEVPLEDNRTNISEICTSWNEKCDRWKRKEREDPHAYRNLTKEEWEARYGTQANPIPSSSGMKKSDVSDKNPSENVRRGRGKKFCTRRRYSSESSKHTNIRHRTLEKDKHKKSRRHSDDRKHSVEYSECINVHNNNSDSNSTNSSSSSSTSTSSSSTSSSDSESAEPNVTKLLRAIKENEKVAKKMSLSETIRDEVNAEIERERKQKSKKSRKNRRSAKRRERKVHHKKRKKRSKKAMSSSETSSDKDKNEEVNTLLTENEIKKEIIENQIIQEVIVKEELDIGQEENIGEDIEFESGNSNHAVIENKALYLLSEFRGKGSPLAQETSLTTVNAILPHVEDKPPITSPTQPKTKAQLKQMPETADMNDNKVPLNVFTTIPEDWSIINLTNISECTENLNKSYQTADISCNQDKTEVSSAGTSQDAIDNTVHVPCGKSKEIAQQIDATICPTESSNSTTKIQADNEISVAVNVSDKTSTVTASASCQASSNPNTATQKQSTSKKIDIKTYYERTIQRRKNEQKEATKSVESSTVSTQNLFKSKNTELGSTINKSVPISVYNSSIQDPRLAARSAATLSSTNSENVIAQTTSRQNVQQEEKKMIKKSKVTELTSKYPEGGSNPINTDSAVKIITQDKPKNKIANANIKILSDITITPKSASSRSKKNSEIEATDKKSQSKVVSNCKKFKNIRSEGSKELKLKKEMTNTKTKKKSTTTSKSANLVSTKVYYHLTETKPKSTDEIIQKKETDNIDDISKTKTERTTKLVSFYEDKINNTNMKIESTISLENIDNSSALHDIDKAKECSLKSELIDCKNTKEATGNIENTDVRDHSLLSSGTMRNEETCTIKHQNDMSNVEIVNKESQSARETSNAASGLDVSIASKIIPKISSYVEKINKGDLFTSNTIEDTEFVLNFTKSNNTKNTNDPIPIEERGVSNVPELNTISRLDDIDNQGKGDKQLINKCAISNVEINDTKENNIKPDMLDGMYKPADADEDNSSAGKTAEVSSASNENSQEQQGIENNVTSPGSTGSPFKGFLQETMMEFEQPNLSNLELGEIDADKKNKLLLDDCNVNCVTHIDNGKEKINIERQQKCETIEPVINYINNDANINNNGNFNVTFGDTLLASDKECATSEKSDKSDLMADESREGYVKKSSNEMVTTTLRDEDNNANISEGSETEKQLIDEERYNAELTIKESMFINEEEMIHGEIQSKDLINKLTTTTDPSLSDALDAANSDDAGDTLRLPENQGTEHLNNHIYLETNISAEKTSCIKLSGFDSDEHLDNDMFYFERLQSFDDKDDESAHFSIHPSPPDNITPAITPETTIITPCADLSHDEIQKPDERKFDFKHISSTNNDLLVEPSVERSPTIIDTPRTLNVPTKAALKEAATSLFLKSPGNISTAAKETAVEIAEKAQQSETDQCYQTPMWHADVHNTKTYPLETHTNTPAAQDFINVNTISSTQNSTSDERTQKNTNTNQSKYSTSSANMEKLLRISMQRNPVVELKKMKELDKMVKKKVQENSEKMKDNVYKVQKKRNGTLLHKLKDKRQMKYRTKKTLNRNSLVKKLKHMKQSEKVAGNTRESILARMLEIDIEMYKLTKEKLKLHEILQSNSLPTENPATNSNAVPREDDIPEKSEMPLTSHLVQDVEVNHAKQVKQVSLPKQSPIKQRKRIASHNSHSEDCEVTNYTQRTKMPVIRWKKKPRLEEVVRREEDEEDDEEEEDEGNLDKRTEQETSTVTADKKANDSADVSESAIQKSNKVCHVRIQETTSKTDTKIDCNVDKSSKRTTCSDKIATEKNTDSEWQNSTRRETERVENFDSDKRNDISVNEIPKTNFQANEIPKTNSQASEIPKTNFQPPNAQVGNTPEPLSIYSDDSTWDSLVQNTASEMHENRKVTGLVLLDETLKKELARTRKMKAIVRKKKKKQLDNFLKVVNNLTMEEEELPLSKLYIKKLQQKRDLLDSLSQGKEELSATVDSKVLKNVDEVINAVAENRVKDLYPQMEARASNDIPTTSTVSSVSQPDKHQLLVDAEANANSDWPCREKENVEEVAVQQESNDMPSVDESNHVFKAVNEVSFYDERNVEPDSSITPEETLMENRSSDCAPPKDPDNTVSRNFDIKVSVPKTLIKEDISIGLLQKCKEPESGVVDTELVDSTTKIFSTNAENLRENDKNPQNNLQIAKSIVEKDKGEKKSETEDKHVADASRKEEATDSIRNTQTMPQSSTAKSGYSDATENENSGDSVASNDKIIRTDITRESSISNSIIENIDTKQKKLSVESEQLSNDVIALKQDYQNVENVAAKEDERSNSESKPRVFEGILDNETSGSLILADRASEKSEESNEMSIEQKSSEYTSTSILPLNKIKSGETNKKIRRKQSNSMPVRRSTRYINENVKPNKINETDGNSNSSESNVHERDLIIQCRSKSPTSETYDEGTTSNVKRNRTAPKVQNTNRKVGEPETKSENPVKPRLLATTESTASKSKVVVISRKRKQHTKWQMTNCKVRLIDCKHLLAKDINSEVLENLGIITINPIISDISHVQRTTHDRDTVITSAASSDKSSLLSDKLCDKEKSEIQILEEKTIKEKSDSNLPQGSTSQVNEIEEQESVRMLYTVHKGPILDIKVFENSFLAASEDGKIYRYSQTSNGILNIYTGHKSAVTCLNIYKSDVANVNKELMYSGSLDGTLCCFNISTGALIKSPVQINSPIQCMDQAWAMIFIGTKSGHVSRFHIKTGVIKGGSIKFSDKSVLALKATNEGPRRILIVASRNQPITIRDAQTGLFLRTISGQKNHTVYSLMRHHNLIYCGTSSTSINVFDFTMGDQIIRYDAGVGIVCMRLYEQLLFAGCYDGNIYVFDTRTHKLVCSIRGPGNMLLSIEVVNNKIIAGSKDKSLQSWHMPTQVRALL